MIKLMKRALVSMLSLIMIFGFCACSSSNTNGKTNTNQQSNNITSSSYSLEYDTFMEKMSQCIGPNEMFLSMEKTSTFKSYDYNFTDLYTLVSMLQKVYSMEIIYNNNSIVSICVRGERNELNENQYSLNSDYIILASVIYQIINQQTDTYLAVQEQFDMSSEDAEIIKTQTTENWIMIYSANKEDISFFCQLKTK